MRTIIGFVLIILIVPKVYGQKNIRNLSNIERTRYQYSGTVEDAIYTAFEANKNDSFKSIDYVHFIKNDKLFLLAYEPLKGETYSFYGKRSIFLYCRDVSNKNGKWELASDTVMTNYYYFESLASENYRDIDFFVYDKNYHNTSIGRVLVEPDCIKITVGVDEMKNGQMIKYGEAYTFVFKNKSYNFYTVYSVIN